MTESLIKKCKRPTHPRHKRKVNRRATRIDERDLALIFKLHVIKACLNKNNRLDRLFEPHSINQVAAEMAISMFPLGSAPPPMTIDPGEGPHAVRRLSNPPLVDPWPSRRPLLMSIVVPPSTAVAVTVQVPLVNDVDAALTRRNSMAPAIPPGPSPSSATLQSCSTSCTDGSVHDATFKAEVAARDFNGRALTTEARSKAEKKTTRRAKNILVFKRKTMEFV